MMECFTYSKTSNGTQGAREIIQCDDPEKQYCFMVYSITEENYDPSTNTIIDTQGIVATNGKCIGLQDKIDVGRGSNHQCANSDKCAYFYPTGNDADDPKRNATAPIRFYHTCCCSEPLCNERTKIDLTPCADSVCKEGTSQNGCFCLEAKDDATPPTRESETETLVMILVSLLVGIAICIVGTMIYFMIQNYIRRRNSDPPIAIDRLQSDGPCSENGILSENGDSEKDLLLPHSEPKKNFEDYKYCDDGPNKLSVCGEGRYGSVHRVENKNTGETFAMKIFRPNNNNNYQMWQKEYEHLRKLSDHRNIVKRFGAGEFYYSGVLCCAILLEYCPLGSLSLWLDNAENVCLHDALSIARDIASGLEFLHEAKQVKTNKDDTKEILRVPVAHRDIKTSNVLLRSNDHALISDFGLAIALTNSSSNPQQNGTLDGASGVNDNKQDIDVNRLKQCGTPRYLSPELLEGPMDVHNFADAFRQADVYSMSLVHWELFNLCSIFNPNHNSIHELPYQRELNGQKPNIAKLQEIVSKGQRPEIPSSFKNTIYGQTIHKILNESWDHDPNARITAATAAQRLNSLVDNYYEDPNYESYDI